MEYLDFEVAIEASGGGHYRVSVLRSPVGETAGEETTQFPFDQEQLRTRLRTVYDTLLQARGARDVVPTPEQVGDGERAAREFGRTLFQMLFAGGVGSLYSDSLRKARQVNGRGLRVKLRTQAPELASLPWELLYDPQWDFVCRSNATPLVRYLALPNPPEALTAKPPLRILGVVASPAGLPTLDIRREKEAMEAAIADWRKEGLVELTWLPGQTWEALDEALRPGGATWHIFHFIGHGGFNSKSNEGYVALATDEGGCYNLTARNLGMLLGDHPTLRVAVLNACEGAKGSGDDLFSSTAAVLVRRGLPAVVSMQREISDQAAIHFARKFYRSLATGSPVDAAVAEARKAVSLALPASVEWATPVLHMRSPDGRLFDLKAPALLAVPAQVDFGQVEEGAMPTITVSVRNQGVGALNWSFTTSGDFFNASRTDDGLSVRLAGRPGTHRGAVQISSNGGEATIVVRADVIAKEPAPGTKAPPSGSLSPQLLVDTTSAHFGFLRVAGSKSVLPIKVKNAGAGDLTWSFEKFGEFFAVTRTGEGLNLELESGAGAHSGSVSISSNGGSAWVPVRALVWPKHTMSVLIGMTVLLALVVTIKAIREKEDGPGVVPAETMDTASPVTGESSTGTSQHGQTSTSASEQAFKPNSVTVEKVDWASGTVKVRYHVDHPGVLGFFTEQFPLGADQCVIGSQYDLARENKVVPQGDGSAQFQLTASQGGGSRSFGVNLWSEKNGHPDSLMKALPQYEKHCQ